MKKLINSPGRYVDESLAGLTMAHTDQVLDGKTQRVVRRSDGIRQGKVGIVSGGGFGHLPLFIGYVGHGLIDTCAVGDVFEGPAYQACLDAAPLSRTTIFTLRVVQFTQGDQPLPWQNLIHLDQEQFLANLFALTGVLGVGEGHLPHRKTQWQVCPWLLPN